MTTCSRCGTTVPEEQPPTWSCELSGAGAPVWLCAACTRDNLRSIEGKLDERWW